MANGGGDGKSGVRRMYSQKAGRQNTKKSKAGYYGGATSTKAKKSIRKSKRGR